MSPHAFAPARRGRSRGRTYRWWCCFTPCGMSSMKVMVGGAESASVTRTSGVCPGSLSRALKVPLSSPSFWQCFLISRAWRTLQASWPDRSRHCARPRGCRPMIVEDTKPGTARPRRSLRVSHTRVAHASGSLRPTRAPRNLCMKSGCFDRPDRKIFSLRGPTMVGRAASRAVTGFPAMIPLSDTYWDFGSTCNIYGIPVLVACKSQLDQALWECGTRA